MAAGRHFDFVNRTQFHPHTVNSTRTHTIRPAHTQFNPHRYKVISHCHISWRRPRDVIIRWSPQATRWGVEFALTQRQRLQQRQANVRRPMHSVKRFTTSACRISFRCQGDVIIDVSRLASFSERSK